MRWMRLGPMAVAGLLILASCEEEPMETGPEACGSSLGAGYVSDFETNADFTTLMAAPMDAGSVHGLMQIWYSNDLAAVIEGGGAVEAPVGATAIKTVDNGNPLHVVMVKEEAGYDPDNGDWCYEFRDTDGTFQDAGVLDSCLGCHTGFSDTDYLGGTDIR